MTESIDEERMTWLTGQVGQLIIAATDRQSGRAAGILAAVGERYDAAGVYGVCCALAETVRVLAFPSVKQGDGSLAGDMLAVERLPGAQHDAAALWAARFVAAYVNGDADTAVALFYGSIRDAEQHVGGVLALVGMVGGIARQVAAERRPS